MQTLPESTSFRPGAVHGLVSPRQGTAAQPDRVICAACADEVLSPSQRRYRYPFAQCNECGPHFSVLKRLPYDHANTALASFDRCIACDCEFYDPTDRHFQSETTFCPACGPRAMLVRWDGGPVPLLEQHSALDDVDAACSLIQKGEVVAIKGLGGWQLACDATNEAAVARLRLAKQSGARPLPLMARDLHVISRYCAISVEEERQLTSPQGPIVILRANGDRLPADIAPGLGTLGFMLPTTALHVLLLQRMKRPVVMTSCNLSGGPQIIDDEEALQVFGVSVRYALSHTYRIANRVEDSVVRVIGGVARVLRRARGYAPEPVKLPDGLERVSNLVAIGGDRKGSFCLVKNGVAIPSPHYADIADMESCKTYQGSICQYRSRLDHKVSVLVIDRDERYFSSNMSRTYTAQWKLGLIEVAHHHAHIAACLTENGYPLEGLPVLGVVLDGRGRDAGDRRGGGEFGLAHYRCFTPLASIKPVTLPGGPHTPRDPWGLLHAYLIAAVGWRIFSENFTGLELYRELRARTRCASNAIDPMDGGETVSSCGHLFSAVAAALGLCLQPQTYDGEAAMRLEAIVDEHALLREATSRYPVLIQKPGTVPLPHIDPTGMWWALLGDLASGIPAPVIAARFHLWLASSIAAMASELAARMPGREAGPTIALSGGCFQNRILFEATEKLLRERDFKVLSHIRMPPHNGGLSLGQAVVGATRILEETLPRQ